MDKCICQNSSNHTLEDLCCSLHVNYVCTVTKRKITKLLSQPNECYNLKQREPLSYEEAGILEDMGREGSRRTLGVHLGVHPSPGEGLHTLERLGKGRRMRVQAQPAPTQVRNNGSSVLSLELE